MKHSHSWEAQTALWAHNMMEGIGGHTCWTAVAYTSTNTVKLVENYVQMPKPATNNQYQVKNNGIGVLAKWFWQFPPQCAN